MTIVRPHFLKILVPTFQTIELIDVNEIISVQAYENYSRLQLLDKRHFTSTQSFGRFTSLLEQYSFFQCHKSYMINLNHIVRYHKVGEVELADGNRLPVARRRKDEFLDAISASLLKS